MVLRYLYFVLVPSGHMLIASIFHHGAFNIANEVAKIMISLHFFRNLCNDANEFCYKVPVLSSIFDLMVLSVEGSI